MPPAARVTDLHTCPMVTPGLPPIPHVGGPVIGPGVPTVLIGGLPAAVLGDTAVCVGPPDAVRFWRGALASVGPPDAVVMGSATVLVGGRPSARMGDSTAHGGVIALGFPTVLIGG